MKKETREEVLEGYRRIAFGDVRDPVRLLFCEDVSPRQLKSMDLFSVAEIKRPRGGGMEIKFFDRIRALECMRELDLDEGPDCGFYRALEQGARALEEEQDGRGDEEPCS